MRTYIRRKGARPLNSHDKQLMNAIYNESDSVDAPMAVNPQATKLGAVQGNPSFAAQFDLSVILRWFTVAAGVYTGTTYAAVAAAQPTTAQVKLPAFLFGNSDFAGGFAKLRAQFPLAVWSYDAPFIAGLGANATQFGLLDVTARGQLVAGDLVQPLVATLGGTNYVVFIIIRATQVAYGTLLDALNSDMFIMNNIRYIVPDATALSLNQYQNNLSVLKQSLFGKFDSDFVSPNSFKTPEQQQQNIIDIPIKKGVDKQVALAVLVNPDIPNGTFQLSFFVSNVDKTAY